MSEQDYDTIQTVNNLSFDAAAPLLLTKANIDSYAQKFIEFVNNSGHCNHLQIAAMLSGLESSIKIIRDGIRDAVVSELKEGGKGSYQGVKIERMETGGKYDYSNCNDVIYNDLKDKVEILSAELKKREEYLKHLPPIGVKTLEEDTGEIITVYPPAKPATTTTFKIIIPSK